MIEQLPMLTPDPARAERLRARCHDRLSRARLRSSAPVQGWERTFVGVCSVDLLAVVLYALQVLSGK